MALPAAKFLQTHVCQCYPCCDEIHLMAGFGTLLKSIAHGDGPEHSSKRRTEDPQPIEKLHRNWAASFSLRGNICASKRCPLCFVNGKGGLLSLANSGAQFYRPSPHTYLWTGILLGYTCSTSWQRPPSSGQSSVLPQAAGSSIGTVCQEQHARELVRLGARDIYPFSQSMGQHGNKRSSVPLSRIAHQPQTS